MQIFVICAYNPFSRFGPNNIPTQGLGFNPLLEDNALLIHPPILYLGYAGTALLFSSILAIIIHSDEYSTDVKFVLKKLTQYVI